MTLKKKLIIGLDFDNTLISYSKVMYDTAVELGLLKGKIVLKSKKQIRDTIRLLPGGELQWQQLQAEVYGRRMDRGRLISGVVKFLRACRDNQIQAFIVSHKTKFASQDKARANDLRQAALGWMRQKGFFNEGGLGVPEAHVYFENSREEKAARIRTLACTHFIDDLEEFFREKTFPKKTVRMLLEKETAKGTVLKGTVPLRSRGQSPLDIKVFRSWGEIYNYFFVKKRAI